MQRGFQPGGALGVADDAVGEAESLRVHRTRWRDADRPITEPSGMVLNRRVRTGGDDVDRRRSVRQSCQVAGGGRAGAKAHVGDDLAQIVEVGLDAGEARRVEARREPLDRLGAGRAVDDELRQQRVVEGRHLGAALDPRIDAHVGREDDLGERPGAGLELLVRILGVETHLDRMADAAPVSDSIDHVSFAGGEADHPLHQVDAGDGLGHRMLDLQTRVHFEEVRLLARRVVDELDGPSRAVCDRRGQALGVGPEARAHAGGQIRRGRLLDDLLVAPLHRAVALTEGDDAAVPVAEDLHLHVPRRFDPAFDE